MALPTTLTVADKIYTAYWADIGTAGSIYITVAGRGRVTAVYITPLVTCATTATVVTPKISSTAMTNGTVTLTSTQAAGTVASGTPTGANFIDGGSAVELATDGGTSTTSPAIVTMVVRETAGN